MTDTTENESVTHVVVGTAGHIDHGKSSLVQCLTGIHPSRLKEEQERGMTIDIGYGEWVVDENTRAGIIDVPGHERFVKNMVAGASGVDFVLLVVAADDGVMMQTREHLQIMRMLGIQRGLTVITKIDLVDEELLEIVVDDVGDYLEGTFLEGAPILRVSNTTGEGIDELAEVLRSSLKEMPARQSEGLFRMPIQRAFSVKGHGTVVTGVPVSGTVQPGDELELLPKGSKARVRGIQVHHKKAARAEAGHRTALNLADISYRDIQRGDVVAEAGYFGSAQLLETRLEYLDHLGGPLRNDTQIRFHLGCVDVAGSVVLLDKKVLLPGETGLAQIRLEEPVVCAANDRFIIRLQSPVITLGGGVVVGETRWRFKRFREWLNENISQKEEQLRSEQGYLEYVIRSHGARLVDRKTIELAMKKRIVDLDEDLSRLQKKRKLRHLHKAKAWIHLDMFKKACKRVSDTLLELHDREKLEAGFMPSRLAKETKLEQALVDAVVEDHVQRKRFSLLQGKFVRNNSYTGGLSKEDFRLVTRIEEMHAAEDFGAPILSEIVADVEKPAKKVKTLLKYLAQMGSIVPISSELCLHARAVAKAQNLLITRLQNGEPMPSSEFKEIIGASRKYVIPLLEYFDKLRLTKRDGNTRVLNPGWEKLIVNQTPTKGGSESTG